MSLIDSIGRTEGPPHFGIPIADIVAALQVIDAAPEISDKRIMGMSVRNNGMLLVKTGEQSAALCGGGFQALLRRTTGGWELVDSAQWCS
jgi:hypothetical protein